MSQKLFGFKIPATAPPGAFVVTGLGFAPVSIGLRAVIPVTGIAWRLEGGGTPTEMYASSFRVETGDSGGGSVTTEVLNVPGVIVASLTSLDPNGFTLTISTNALPVAGLPVFCYAHD